MAGSSRSKGRRRAIVVGAICVGLLVHHWQSPGGCFVTAPGGQQKHHQVGTARQLHRIDTAATEPNIVCSNNVWDSWLAMPWVPDVVDSAIAALGAGCALLFVSYLDGISPVRLYAAPLASSVILVFANSKPPRLNNVLIGTAGPAFGSVVCHTLLSQFLPVVVMRSLSVAISLVFFKFTGFFFPPAAAIAALGVDNETFANLSWSYVLFPAVTGNALLFGLATLLSNVREEIRAVLTARQWQLSTRDEKLIQTIFERCDLDGGGTVDLNELNVGMRYLVGKDISLDLTKELMAKVDADGDGSLDLNEFTGVLDAYQSLQAHEHSQKTA